MGWTDWASTVFLRLVILLSFGPFHTPCPSVAVVESVLPVHVAAVVVGFVVGVEIVAGVVGGSAVCVL